MEATRDRSWYQYPPVVLPSPVLALATSQQGIWAGGAGGVAWYPIHTDWQPRISGLPLSSVAALLTIEGQLIAGGMGGIAYSSDEGRSWKTAEIQNGGDPILAFAASSQTAQKKTLLAATLEHGILRSDDLGKHWYPSTTGLQNFEVTTLAWTLDEHVLTGTTNGIYHSPDSGQTWHLTHGSAGYEVGALTYLPDGTTLAALESGGLLHSSDKGITWDKLEDVPTNIAGSAFSVTGEGTLLWGTLGNGILRSTDSGHSWQQVHESTVLSFAANGDTLYAGHSNGLSVSVDDGITWISLPHPPIHDLRRILIVDGQPLLIGAYAGLQRYGRKQAWTPLPSPGTPLSTLEQVSGGTLIASSMEGLARSMDSGQSWQTVLANERGQVAYLTFREDGTGWAGKKEGAYLLYTDDGGLTWEQRATPFGALPLMALQITMEGLLAATYDPEQSRACIWHSFDAGRSWQRSIEAVTSWPIIEISNEPALFTLGGTLFRQQPDGSWVQKQVGNGQEGIRRVAANSQIVVVQTRNHLYSSTDKAETWEVDESDLPLDQVLDVEIADNTIYALLTAGRVWSRSLI
ncbi:MAG: hypothetical protein JO011_01655 [Ktedonobacteraceae bacterium]|nr:hypothetical protein [Ktedonobacteraceae bacterium]